MTIKTFKFPIMLLMAAALTGCSGNEGLLGQEELPGTISAPTMTVQAITDDSSTRTSLQKDGDYRVVWSEGDKILIGGQEFTLVSGAGTTSAEFEGPQLEDGSYNAFYGTTSDVIQDVQTYIAGTVSNAPMKAQVTVSGGKAAPASFHNIGGLLRLTVMDSHSTFLKSIKVSGEQSDGVSATPFSFTLDCGQDGAKLMPQGTIFYLAMPEGSYGNVKIEMTGTDGSKCVKTLGTGKKLGINRAQITRAEFTTLFYKLLNGHEYEDLGLPSKTMWATCNVGAQYPKESGDYLAWGETAGKQNYSLAYYSLYSAGDTIYTYPKGSAGDWKRTLDQDDDAASRKWGDKWRMPTKRELEELRDFCYWVWTDSYSGSGVKGYIVYKAKSEAEQGRLIAKGETPSLRYSLADRHIFLPASGMYSDTQLSDNNLAGRYWSSSLNLNNLNVSGCLSFASAKAEMGYCPREQGFTVRPVYSEPQDESDKVDLGLNVYWATCNVGTSSPVGYGGYVAWGERFEKEKYYWFNENDDPANYKFGKPSYEVTKYTYSYPTLELEDDVAYRTLNGNWRMPTRSEMQELISNCEFIWENDYNDTGVNGYLVTSNVKGYRHVSIFLPAAGYKDDALGSGLQHEGSYCYYWSSTLNNLNNTRADGFFNGWGYNMDDSGKLRSYGCSVRPVMSK